MLVAVFELGRLAGGSQLGLVAMCFCGSSYIFLKFAREASYDTQLACWVTVTNVFLAHVLLRQQWWVGCTGGGIALGLALMTKGPVAILQTIIPIFVLLGFERWRGRSGRPKVDWPAMVVGIILCLATALPWTIYIWRKVPDAISLWFGEVTLKVEGQLEKRTTVWFAYFAFVLWIIPWTIWFIAGLWKDSDSSWSIGRRRGINLMIAWVFVPLIVMWFFPERRDRYVLPMIPPAAAIAAFGFLRYLSRDRRPRWPLIVHWATVALVAIGLAIAGATGMGVIRMVNAGHWFSLTQAISIVAVTILLLLLCIRWQKPSGLRLAIGTFAIMLVVQTAFTYGYARSPRGVSEAKPFVEAIRAGAPDALVYNTVNRERRKDLPLEMTIYFNQVVPREADVKSLKPARRPQVIVFPDGAEMPPDGFKLLARNQIKNEWWNAYVLPPLQR
jgi:4-amino-4-deoxy-L-arabinose transferase-like glycosyltransferase